MKLKYLVVLLIFCLSANVYASEREKFGIGVILGEPTGITAKIMLNDTNAIDMGAGWKTSGDNELHIYGDYLFHMYDVIPVPKGLLPLYFGAGARIVFHENDDNEVGIRIPVGVEYVFEDIPLGAFVELVPVLDLTPDTEFDFEAGTGIRYFF